MKAPTCDVRKEGRTYILQSKHDIKGAKVTIKMAFTPKSKKIFLAEYSGKGTWDCVPCLVFFYLSQTIENILQRYTYLLSGHMTITLEPIHVEGHMELMSYHGGTKKRINLTTTWHYLIQTIITPYFTGKEPDLEGLGRVIAHEVVGHFGDTLGGLDKAQRASERKLYAANPKLQLLNKVFYDLRAEGLAMYQERFGAKTTIRKHDIDLFRRNVCKMMRMRDMKKMQAFYEKELLVEEGLYTAGMLMCLTIALAQAKRKGVVVDRYPWRWSVHAWAGARAYTVGAIPKRIFMQTYRMIAKNNVPTLFFRHYTNACKELGIGEDRQAISENLYFALLDKATGIKEALLRTCAKCNTFVDYYTHKFM